MCIHRVRFHPLFPIAVLLVFVVAPARAADTYQVDNVHSSVVFKLKHLDTGFIWGRFNKLEGTVQTEGNEPKSFAFTVATSSVDTGNPGRDKHLRTPDFFAAEEFPKITFKSTDVKSAGENKYEVTGTLSMHGKEKPVTVVMERTGSSKTEMQGEKLGFATSFTVKRSDFAMKAMPMLSDDVEIHFSTEVKKS